MPLASMASSSPYGRERSSFMPKLVLEEWPHAYLVVGTISIDKARAFMEDQEKDGSMPCRPLTFKGKQCVAFYFNIAGEEPTKQERARYP